MSSRTPDPSPGSPGGLREPAHRVSPRARHLWRVEAGLGALVPVVAAIVVRLVWDVAWLPWWLVGVVVVLGAAWAALVPEWRYRVHRWEATDTAVYTQVGWWSLERRIAPMSRVQTVDLEEGALARIFGLASVTVTTASAAGPLEIAGLDRDDARALVDDLTLRADAVEGDAT